MKRDLVINNTGGGTLSIIIPIYNAERYLECCLNSVLNQTFNDFEVLLIDDGSKDCSEHICQKYVEKDKRFKYYQKENGGVSSARNFGLDMASGKYIAFIDADDCIHKNYFEYLIKGAVDNGCGIVRCKVSQDEKILSEEVKYKFVKETEPSLHGYVHSSIYLKSVIGDCKFDERFFYCEDILFDTCVVKTGATSGLVDLSLYFYRKNLNSATSTFKSTRYFSGLQALNAAIETFAVNATTEGKVIHPLLKHRELCRLKYMVAISYEKKHDALDAIKIQRNDFYKDYRYLSSDKKIKFVALLFKLPLSMVCLILRLIGVFWTKKKKLKKE